MCFVKERFFIDCEEETKRIIRDILKLLLFCVTGMFTIQFLMFTNELDGILEFDHLEGVVQHSCQRIVGLSAVDSRAVAELKR